MDTNTMKQELLEYVATLSSKEYRDILKEAQLQRWESAGFPKAMHKWHQEGISKLRGDAWENEFVETCTNLNPKRNGAHDAILDNKVVAAQGLKGDEIEIKFFSALDPQSAKTIEQRGYALTWAERALPVRTEGDTVLRPKGGSFQQVKPSCAHYGLFSAVYGNGAVHYWLPYHLISKQPKVTNAKPGEVPLSGQHRGHTVEGQINMSQRFHDLFFLDVTYDSPFITDLSKYDLKKYDNAVF